MTAPPGGTGFGGQHSGFVERSRESGLVHSSHISNAVNVRNVVVDTAASGDSGVIDSFTTSSTLIWVVYYAHFVATGVTNQTVLIKSGSTEVGRFWQQGTIAQAWPKTFENGGHPVWIGRAAGDILQINLSAASQMNAFFLVGEIAA